MDNKSEIKMNLKKNKYQFYYVSCIQRNNDKRKLDRLQTII